MKNGASDPGGGGATSGSAAGPTEVTSSLWKFEHVEKGIGRIAIVDRNIGFRPEPLHEYLRAAAQVIRIDDPDAADQLRAAFGIKTP